MNRNHMMSRMTLRFSALLILAFVGCCFSGCVRSMLQSDLPEPDDTPRSVAESLATPQLRNPADLKPSEGAQACVGTADSLAAKGHEAEAVKLLLKARQLDPKQQVAHRLAVLYDRNGDDKQALREYEIALQQMPKNSNLLNDLGYFYYQRENWTEAEQYFQTALQQSPENRRAQTNLALTYAKQGKYEESLALFTRVVGPAAAHSNLGVLHAQAGRHAEAKRELQQALAIDPTLSQAEAILAHVEKGYIAQSRQ